MKTIIFDGKAFAAEKEKELRKKVSQLKEKGIIPKLATILVGNDPASKMYVNMKKRVAVRIGCELLVVNFKKDTDKQEIIEKIRSFNNDEFVNGIMIQLQLPDTFLEEDRDEIINSIDKRKDVDGLREDSPYVAPTVKSVIYTIKQALLFMPCRGNPCKVVVVGYTGFEGGKIFKALKEMSCLSAGKICDVEGVNSKTKNLKEKTQEADILISATGSPGIIKGDMVKEGAVVIDVGAPKGDAVKDEVIGKASFISPVPGGVGPVTIVSLLENLIDSAS